MCREDPVDRRSGVGTVGPVHQSCCRNCVLFFLATLQLLRVQLALLLSAPASCQEEQRWLLQAPSPSSALSPMLWVLTAHRPGVLALGIQMLPLPIRCQAENGAAVLQKNY